MPTASIGTIVHFVDGKKVHLPSIVSSVESATKLDLVVFNPDGIVDSARDVPLDSGATKGYTWHFPE